MKAELIDFMGDDITVVNAARVSFDKESDWCFDESYVRPITLEPVIYLSEKDQKLISYLAKHNHWTPFSHVMITMRETVPIFVARQRFKHMVGFTYNEVSRRYVDDEPEFYVPEVWRGKPENAKQGSSDEILNDIKLELMHPGDTVKSDLTVDHSYKVFLWYASKLYKGMIDAGVAPEQARMVLPQSMYTSYYCTGSLAAWARAYKQRIDPHSQKEIQDLAKMWGNVIGEIKGLENSWKVLIE